VRDSLDVFCKLDSSAEALLATMGECSWSTFAVSDTSIASVPHKLKYASVDCNGVSYNEIMIYNENEYVGYHSASWRLVLPVLPFGESHLPTFYIKVMNDEGQSTVTYSLQSKTGTVDEALFEISSDYKELTFIEFMSVSE
jgi:hypothetical protein